MSDADVNLMGWYVLGYTIAIECVTLAVGLAVIKCAGFFREYNQWLQSRSLESVRGIHPSITELVWVLQIDFADGGDSVFFMSPDRAAVMRSRPQIGDNHIDRVVSCVNVHKSDRK